MGNIGDPITQSIPAVSSGGTSYATQINAYLTEVGARLAAKVPIASILAGLLDMAANAIKNVSYLAFSDSGGTPSTPTTSIQSFSGNMWWVSPVGAVQVTSGNTLNAAALAGITGDYGGGNPAQFRYVNTDKEFYAYQDFAGGKWAYLGGLGLDIFGGLTSAVKAHITYGGAGTINLVLPPSLPAGPAILYLDNTGAITTTANSTVDLVLGNNVNVQVQGTGYYKRSSATYTIAAQNPLSVVVSGSTTNAGPGVNVAASSAVYIPIHVPSAESDRVSVTSVLVSCATMGGTGNITAQLFSHDFFLGFSALGAATTVAVPTSQFTVTNGLPHTFNGSTMWLKITTAGTNTVTVSTATVTNTLP